MEKIELLLQVSPLPANTNRHGDIFGGWLLSQADIAGGILAARRAGGRVATVAVKDFHFQKPIYTGDVVRIFGKIIHIGLTSITVALEIFAERADSGQTEQAAQGVFVYVHIGPDRRPAPVPAEV